MRVRPHRTIEPAEVVTLNIDVVEEVARPTGPALRVLLLEDRADFRGVLHDYLVSCSYNVTAVDSGVDGLREIMSRGFDVILCDMMMPKMGGEMFYWAVTRVRPAAAQKFIFFTGHKNNPQLEFFFKRVNATVLSKPFKLSALDAAIGNLMRKVA